MLAELVLVALCLFFASKSAVVNWLTGPAVAPAAGPAVEVHWANSRPSP